VSSRWPLHRLAKLGDADAVETWLDAHPDAAKTAISAYNDRGETPLMCAVGSARRSVALVDLLLVRGARIDLPTRSAWAPPHNVLELAIGAGSVDVVSRLIELGADVRAVREHGYTAMHAAAYSRVEAESRQVQLIELLAGHGAAHLL
jgi:ankyrin repeat protein